MIGLKDVHVKKIRIILSAPRKKLRYNLKNVFVKRTENADTNNIQVSMNCVYFITNNTL